MDKKLERTRLRCPIGSILWTSGLSVVSTTLFKMDVFPAFALPIMRTRNWTSEGVWGRFCCASIAPERKTEDRSGSRTGGCEIAGCPSDRRNFKVQVVRIQHQYLSGNELKTCQCRPRPPPSDRSMRRRLADTKHPFLRGFETLM
jgi:hypothetical protein